MKNINIKLFIVFLAGILFSAITVFAATINVSTNFTSNAVQHLQSLVIKDALGTIKAIINGNDNNILTLQGDGHILGNLGIGTYPDSNIKVDIKGSLRTSNYGGNNGIGIWTDPTSDNLHVLYGWGNGMNWEIGASYLMGGNNMFSIGTNTNNPIGIFTNNNQAIHIGTDGNVGIGNFPSQRLDVNGTGKFSNAVIASKFCDSNGTTCSDVASMIGGGGTSLWSTGTADSIYYNNGNVGVGTTTPNNALDVSGNVLILGNGQPLTITNRANQNPTSLSFKTLDNNLSDILVWSLELDAPGFSIKNNTQNRTEVFISTGGNVGIGTNDPDQKLAVNGNFSVGTPNTSQLTIDNSSLSSNLKSTERLELYTNNSRRVTINKSGYVGIGENNPRANLHLSGSLIALSSVETRAYGSGSSVVYLPRLVTSQTGNTPLDSDSIRYISCLSGNLGSVLFGFTGQNNNHYFIMWAGVGGTLTYHLKAGETAKVDNQLSGHCVSSYIRSQEYGKHPPAPTSPFQLPNLVNFGNVFSSIL